MALFYEDVLAALIQAGVRFVIVGGTAVILQGVPRTTADLDVAIDLDDANVRRLVDCLTTLGFRPRAPVAATELADPERRREWITEKGMLAFSFHRPNRPLDEVDVLIAASVPFAELIARADHFEAGGMNLAVAAIEDLISLKSNTGRAQDTADVDALRRLQEAERGR